MGSVHVCKAVQWHNFLLLKLMLAFLPCLPKGTCTSLVCNCCFCFLHSEQKLWIWCFHLLGLTGRTASRISEGAILCCCHLFSLQLGSRRGHGYTAFHPSTWKRNSPCHSAAWCSGAACCSPANLLKQHCPHTEPPLCSAVFFPCCSQAMGYVWSGATRWC